MVILIPFLWEQEVVIISLKAGYNYSFNKNNYWENGIDNTNSNFLVNNNSIFFQLNIGGIIGLKNKK